MEKLKPHLREEIEDMDNRELVERLKGYAEARAFMGERGNHQVTQELSFMIEHVQDELIKRLEQKS